MRDPLPELSHRPLSGPGAPLRARVRLECHGRVQGVGFRPFAARLARELGIGGWVRNAACGAVVEAEGAREAVERFIALLEEGTPASGAIRCRPEWIGPQGAARFEILASDLGGTAGAMLAPDMAVCAECLSEMRDPADRRYRYPFINCSHCGPRASIIAALPHDRERTAMAKFAMCAECRREYQSPEDRRHHAEATCCAACGPRLEWRGAGGGVASGEEALALAASALRDGGVIAVKGISGFHLMADARSDRAIGRLREIKRRDAKPLAVMFASLADAERETRLCDAARRSLDSAEAPIALVERRESSSLAAGLARFNPLLGAMLAYAPLHHLLLEALGGPVAATSANFGEEPIIIGAEGAERAFGGAIAGILSHDRNIVRRADDSVVRVIDRCARVLRAGRGIAPASFDIPARFAMAGGRRCILALGGQERSSIALALGGEIHLGRHLGDLESVAAREAYRETIADLLRLHGAEPELIVCDLHPDYFSSRVAEEIARERGRELLRVQHHAAHLFSALLDSGAPERGMMGACWDGTGLGDDGEIWGAEWIAVDDSAPEGWRRVGTMRPIPLSGGEVCAREPWRVALALANEAGIDLGELRFGPDRSGFEPNPAARRPVEGMLRRGTGLPRASSMGRLFDGVASLLGLRHRAEFSAQPAMELEFAGAASAAHRAYECAIASKGGVMSLDWRPMIREAVADLGAGVDCGAIAAAFHEGLARGCAAMALALDARAVALTGGCFQNKLLAERCAGFLREAGIEPRLHRAIPPNDGGLAAGQALLGLRRLQSMR